MEDPIKENIPIGETSEHFVVADLKIDIDKLKKDISHLDDNQFKKRVEEVKSQLHEYITQNTKTILYQGVLKMNMEVMLTMNRIRIVLCVLLLSSPIAFLWTTSITPRTIGSMFLTFILLVASSFLVEIIFIARNNRLNGYE